jgi:hypothetical protein
MSAGDEESAWFAPKRYGFGAGLPIAWQGWALLGAYVAILAATSVLIERSLIAWLAIMASMTALLLIIVARTTRGGWRWRWKGRGQ